MKKFIALFLMISFMISYTTFASAESMELGKPVSISTKNGSFIYQLDWAHIVDFVGAQKEDGVVLITVQGILENIDYDTWNEEIRSYDFGGNILIVEDQDGFSLEYYGITGPKDGVYEVCGDVKQGTKKRISIPFFAPEGTTSVYVSFAGYDKVEIPIQDKENETDAEISMEDYVTLKRQLETKAKKIQELEEKIEEYETQISTLKTENAKIEQMSKQISDRDNEITDLKKQIALLQESPKIEETTEDKVAEEGSESTKKTSEEYTTIRKGDKGQSVVTLQKRLIELNYLSAGGADGDYGQGTENAVSAFQHSVGLPETGIADDATQQKIFSDSAPKAKVYTQIQYKEIARNPDAHKGDLIQFYGKVLQVSENGNRIVFRISSRGSYDDVVYCTYEKPSEYKRVLEDDKVTVYGVCKGIYTYTTIFGAEVTIPACEIDRIDVRPY